MNLLPDFRAGALIIHPLGPCLFMAALAHLCGAYSQRNKEAFLRANWRRFRSVCLAVGVHCAEHAPSDSTIRRLCEGADYEKASAILRELSTERLVADFSVDAPPRHYAIDGKARLSAPTGTGKTEIDISLFDVDTKSIVGKAIVGAKEGEQPVSRELAREFARDLPTGIFTGDAGIVSPGLTRALVGMFHDYLFTIKGNAGEAHNLIKAMPWRELPFDDVIVDEGHGRQEVRTLKLARIPGAGIDSLEKYEAISYIGEVQRYRKNLATGEESVETAYFVGSEEHVRVSADMVASLLRGHWSIENHLHRPRDVELLEDALPPMGKAVSRMHGVFTDLMTFLARGLTKGLRYFLQTIRADPMALLEPWLLV